MISMSSVSFAYKEKNILENFTLNIGSGERVCLFGESGIGKTTVLRLLCGLEKPQKGEASVKGEVSAVFQENRLLPFKTVLGNIAAVNGDISLAEKLLQKFGLYEYKDKYPRSLSGGMKRRVAIIRALSREFDILILDEPFNGIDKENITLIADIINESTRDKTVVLVTHSEWEAQSLKAKIINM